MIKMNTALRATAIGALLFAASAVQAAPVFTVTPSGNGLSNIAGTFQADAMAGNSSARITQTGMSGSNYVYSGTGYIQYTAFQLNDDALLASDTGANFNYKLYATFTQTFLCSSALAPGVSCGVSGINLTLSADKGGHSSFTKASVGSDYTFSANGDQQIVLGNVDTVLGGTAGIDTLGGAFQNVNTNFTLTDEGKAFFTAPVPFYSFAFSAFNNTTQGLSCNGNTAQAANGCAGAFTTVAINQESGITDFNAVPEPGALALVGIGMLGLAGLRRKARK
jgi:hypothetical protein